MSKISEYCLINWLKKYNFIFLTVLLLLLQAVVPAGALQASDTYFTVNTQWLPNGTEIEEVIIIGPPRPPHGFEFERQAVSLPEPNSAAGTNVLTVPAFNWVFGCSAVSGAMIAGYYDRSGWPNIYTGPTNGGVMPLNNSSWPTWSDGYDTYPNCPLIASKNGVDGRVSRGSIDDYWVQYNSTASDPYITHGWTQHAWGDAIGDYMKTSQSEFLSVDGSTTFWNYTSSSPLTCATMASSTQPLMTNDGTLGRKLFYEARGYTVTDCYNQKTDNTIAGGFSFAQFKAEIDAGRPVMLNLAGHTVVGFGYDDATNLIYIHDTWDYNDHTMIWGGSYSGRGLLSVSIVNLSASVILNPPSNLTATVTSSSQINLTWTDNSNNESGFRIERKTGASGTWGEIATTTANVTSYASTGLSASTAYSYRVKSYNATGNSGYSNEANATTSGSGCTSSTTAISSGSTLSGTLATTDCKSTVRSGKYYDNFTFAATAGTAYTITLNSTAFDAYLYLLNSAGAVLASNDDGNGGTNSKIVYTPTAAGTLTIHATTYSSGATGAYTVSLSGGGTSTVPAAPSNLTAAAASASQINLTWTDNSNNESGFRIERKTGTSGTWGEIATTAANATSYASTGLSASTLYYYRVRSYNATGNSTSYSNEANATTSGSGTVPSAPSNLTAAAASASQINLTWTDNSNNESGFRIERKTGTSGTWGEIATTAANVTSYASTGLSASTAYYYRVRAYNATGNSTSYSNEANATTSGSGIVELTVNGPTVTGNISPAGDLDWFQFTASVSGTYTIETWAGTLTDNYMYLYGPNNQTTLVAQDDDSGIGYAAKITRALTNTGTYYVKVKAYSSSGTGTYTINVKK